MCRGVQTGRLHTQLIAENGRWREKQSDDKKKGKTLYNLFCIFYRIIKFNKFGVLLSDFFCLPVLLTE